MNFNRRKHIRYTTTGSEIVARNAFSNDEAAVQDISLSGIRLQYMSEDDRSKQWREVNIYSGECNPTLMANVCCEVAYDIKGLMEYGKFSGLNVRLCGLCFGELTQDQTAALQSLLNCHGNSR